MAERKQMEVSDESRERERTQALAFELRQIIQADRMAMDIIQNAEYSRKDIEKKTHQETAAILEEAKDKMEQATREAEKVHAEEMDRRKKEAEQAFARQRGRLEEHFSKNRAAWVEKITGAIIGGNAPEEGALSKGPASEEGPASKGGEA